MTLEVIVQPLPLTELVRDSLRESILRHDLVAGHTYNEMTLAKELGVSRTPIRAALLQLAFQGLVTLLPRRGIMINNFSVQNVLEVFELRTVIEISTVEKVARAYVECDFERLRNTLRVNTTAAGRKDMDTFLRSERSLHSEIVSLANNSFMRSTLENLRDLIHVMSVEALTKPQRVDEVAFEHTQVVGRLCEGDVEGARAAMLTHLDNSRAAALEQHALLASLVAPRADS